MINDIRFTLKNLNREKTLSKILKICEVKNVKINEDTYSFEISKKYKKSVQQLLNKQEISFIDTKNVGGISFLKNTIFRLGVIIPIIMFLVFLYISNMFVFNYKIYGNEMIDSKEIEFILQKQNVAGITRKADIDIVKLTNSLQTKNHKNVLCGIICRFANLIFRLRCYIL